MFAKVWIYRRKQKQIEAATTASCGWHSFQINKVIADFVAKLLILE
jgi:hypothetical protein